MKKGKVVATILLVVIVGILMFIVGQYASSKMDYNMFKESEKDNKTEEKKNSVMPEISKEHKFVKSVSSDVFFSGKKHNLMVYYYKEDFKLDEKDKYYEEAKINNLLNGAEIYTEIYLDNKKIVDMTKTDFAKNQDLKEIDEINSYIFGKYSILSDENIDSNKEYLLIKYYNTNDEDFGNFIGLIPWGMQDSVLVDENGNVLDSYRLHDGGLTMDGIKVDNNQISKLTDRNLKYVSDNDYNGFIIDYNRNYLDIKSSYMYYLDFPSGCDSQKVNEYKIIIKDGKLNKEKINTYTFDQLELAGGNCRQK